MNATHDAIAYLAENISFGNLQNKSPYWKHEQQTKIQSSSILPAETAKKQMVAITAKRILVVVESVRTRVTS